MQKACRRGIHNLSYICYTNHKRCSSHLKMSLSQYRTPALIKLSTVKLLCFSLRPVSKKILKPNPRTSSQSFKLASIAGDMAFSTHLSNSTGSKISNLQIAKKETHVRNQFFLLNKTNINKDKYLNQSQSMQLTTP